MYDVWNTYLGWDNGLDYVKVTDVRSYTLNNITIAEIDIHLRWYHSTLRSRNICRQGICRIIKWVYKDYFNEYTTFSKTITPPDNVCKDTLLMRE